MSCHVTQLIHRSLHMRIRSENMRNVGDHRAAEVDTSSEIPQNDRSCQYEVI